MFGFQLLENVQWLGAQAVTKVFNIMARCVAESETRVEQVTIRHHNQQPAAKLWWHTRPPEHHFWKIKTVHNTSHKRWVSLLQKIAEKFVSFDVYKVKKLKHMPEARKQAYI